MEITEAKQKIKTLREKLEYYAKKYYDEDNPEITDRMTSRKIFPLSH